MQVLPIEDAERKREVLEEQLTLINKEWIDTIEEIERQSLQFLSENEEHEFKARLHILVKEM